MSYVTPKQAQEYFNVSDQTLRRWSDEGKIQHKLTKGNHRRYYIPGNTRKKIIYCRVSSVKQKGDLKRQNKFMQKKYPNHEIVQDIGSGINHKRPGFRAILKSLFFGTIQEVVVASPDRFSRFNYELLEWIFKNHRKMKIF